MPGLNPQVEMHRLNINPQAKLVRQPQHRFNPEIMGSIEYEVKKLIDSGFIRKEQYPDWVAKYCPDRREEWEDPDLHRLPRSQ